jgi:hypothetical protein
MKDTQMFLSHVHRDIDRWEIINAFDELVGIIETMQQKTVELKAEIEGLEIEINKLSKKEKKE